MLLNEGYARAWLLKHADHTRLLDKNDGKIPQVNSYVFYEVCFQTEDELEITVGEAHRLVSDEIESLCG